MNAREYIIQQAGHHDAKQVTSKWGVEFTDAVAKFLNTLEPGRPRSSAAFQVISLAPNDGEYILLNADFLSMEASPWTFDYKQVTDKEALLLPVWHELHKEKKNGRFAEINRLHLMIVGILTHLKKDYDAIIKMGYRKDMNSKRYNDAVVRMYNRAYDLLDKHNMLHIEGAFDEKLSQNIFADSPLPECIVSSQSEVDQLSTPFLFL